MIYKPYTRSMKELLITWIECQIDMFMPDSSKDNDIIFNKILQSTEEQKKKYSKQLIACAKLFELKNLLKND